MVKLEFVVVIDGRYLDAKYTENISKWVSDFKNVFNGQALERLVHISDSHLWRWRSSGRCPKPCSRLPQHCPHPRPKYTLSQEKRSIRCREN
jgi:hypothetical protein